VSNSDSGPDERGVAPTVPDPDADALDATAVFEEGEEFDLRPGADSCYKCSACDVSCPVAEVDDDFPGPTFQGPEQWRLKQNEDDYGVDESVMDCSNCMRCDDACPSGVPLSQMHNTARAQYVDGEMSRLSREYVRNRILANYRLFASVASRVPRLSTAVLHSRPVRWLNENLLGISSEREFPAFATETFREWWAARGGAATSRKHAQTARECRGEPGADRKVAYFHGCYADYNTPEVGTALIRVFEHFGYELVVPEQRVRGRRCSPIGCSRTPAVRRG